MSRRFLLDTNVLIDLCAVNRPQHSEAQTMLLSGEMRGDEFVVCVSSLKDAYYVLERHYVSDESIARQAIARMMSFLTVADLTFEVARSAIVSDEPDFEDGLIRAVAEASGCVAIVSRDVRAFVNSPVPRVDPSRLSE